MASVLNESIHRILWAIDPFETEIAVDPSAFDELKRWQTEKGILIEPVYIFTPSSQQPSQSDVTDRISTFIQQSKVETLPPTVLVEPSYSNASRIATLISHAVAHDAALIAVSSRCRSGLKRVMFGSFAESLLNISPLPVLFLNHLPRPEKMDPKKALWATDFSDHCQLGFETFLKQAQGIFEEIILFNDLSLTVEMSEYAMQWDGSVINIDELIEAKRQLAWRQSTAWAEKVTRYGFREKTIIESGYNVSLDILHTARETGAGWIAMTSRTGPFASWLLGSHSRQVFRDSRFPVWVYGPGFCEAIKTYSNADEKIKRNNGIDETPAEFLEGRF